MNASTRLVAYLCLALCCSLVATAQTLAPKVPTATESKLGPSVTLSPTAGGVRVVAQGAVSHVRLEVYPIAQDETAAPDALLSTRFARGNLHDWALVDAQGQPLPDGKYLFVVTARDLNAQLWFKKVPLMVQGGQAAVELSDAGELSAGAQKQKSVAEVPAMTVTAHTGQESHIISTRGGFSFRIGNLFAGQDKEVMRVSEDGNVNVPGTISATKGIEFSDGTVQTSGLSGRKDKNGNIVPNASGSGTQGRLAKWTDDSGTLGDSVALDTGTGLQLTALPSNAIDTNLLYLNSTNGTTGVLAGSTPSFTANNGPYFAMRGNTYSAISGQRGNFVISAGNVSSPGPLEGVVKFITGNDALRMLITPAGNVGIGTPAPQSLLDVAGDINTSTQFDIGGNRVLSVTGGTQFPNSNTFTGIGAGALNAPTNGFNGNKNSFFGFNAGGKNTTGQQNSFFGFQAGFNNTGSFNSFFGESAGFNNNSGARNSFFGSEAGFNVTGNDNTLIGASANGGGNNNTSVGSSAGFTNGGNSNIFIGHSADFLAQNGSVGSNNNTVIGENATIDLIGIPSIPISNSTAIGAGARIGSTGTGGSNSTAIGANAQVTQDNSIVLGSIHNINNATADTSVGIGTTAPVYRLHVVDPGAAGLRVQTNTGGGAVASFGGNGDFQIDSNGAAGGRFIVQQGGNVGVGTAAPDNKLTVNGTADKPGGGSWGTFSDERLKTIRGRFTLGLHALMQLQPIRYRYTPDNALGIHDDGEHVGFGAQAVAQLIPEAVTQDEQGYLLVNNDPILWTMLNAIKEQQREIEQLRGQLRQLRTVGHRRRPRS